MYKITIVVFSFLFTFILGDKYSNANQQECISSNGTSNHETGNFPTRGNPHKFKNKKLSSVFQRTQ